MASVEGQAEIQAHQAGRLVARPAPPGEAAQHGLHPLGLVAGRDALLYVPPSYRPDHPTPLVVMLHGAGGNEYHGLAPLQGLADSTGLILLSPASRGDTWDVIRGPFGPDIAFIDHALGYTFRRYVIDPARMAVGGFSDGASYALSVGLTNGDLFTHIIAFSPGFMAPEAQRGRPAVFISHGTQDGVLPIARCSRRIVPALRRAGYDVAYEELDDGHTVPAAIAEAAVDWFLG